MELRDIEYFGVIAEHRNMRRAASALGVTPSALSKSLRRLETAMEAPLMQRTGRGVEPTPFGEALAAQARKLRLTLEDITREASDLSKGRTGHLRIGATPTECEMLPAACTRLMNELPSLTLDVAISDNDELIPLVVQGKLDLALTALPPVAPHGIEQIPLFDDAYVVYAAAHHPLAKRRRVALADLVEQRWTTSTANYRPLELLMRVFADHGLPEPRFAMRSRNVRLRVQFVASSQLLGFGTRLVARLAMRRYALKILPVHELTLPRSAGVMYRQGAYLPPAALRLIELLKRTQITGSGSAERW